MLIPASRRDGGFTLIEMLVVIAIIAILAAALFPKISQVQENGWATRCKANLKNLYQATLNFENDNSQAIPRAGSYESRGMDGKYYELQGWVRWLPQGGKPPWPTWPNDSSPAGSMIKQDGTVVNTYWRGDTALVSITNGAIWECSGNQLSAYLCPRFARKSYCGVADARRSYVMNGFFECSDADWNGWWARSIQNNLDNKDPSRLPLFCDGDKDTSIVKNDSVLQLNTGDNPQSNPNWTKPAKGFGCVHKIGGAMRCQVVYLDGHITAVTNLTYAACVGNE
jgi:prepilin-type N-terminal cleavage/methylation domain-containing protein